jgi:hypothetical protein
VRAGDVGRRKDEGVEQAHTNSRIPKTPLNVGVVPSLAESIPFPGQTPSWSELVSAVGRITVMVHLFVQRIHMALTRL